MTTTIAQFAIETGAQQYEIAAFFDLGKDWTPDTELTAEDVQIWRDAEAELLGTAE